MPKRIQRSRRRDWPPAVLLSATRAGSTITVSVTLDEHDVGLLPHPEMQAIARAAAGRSEEEDAAP